MITLQNVDVKFCELNHRLVDLFTRTSEFGTMHLQMCTKPVNSSPKYTGKYVGSASMYEDTEEKLDVRTEAQRKFIILGLTYTHAW